MDSTVARGNIISTDLHLSLTSQIKTKPYIDASHVGLGYRDSKDGIYHLACADLDFKIAEGEFVVIVGPSGCGKSTFLEALAGLVDVTTGALRIGGKAVCGPGRNRGLVFQSPSLFPWLTVRRNIEFGLRAQRRLTRDARSEVDSIIELVGLGHNANKYPRQLSGGMKQRVNLARALVTQPDLLLLDEPFGALDAQTRETMQSELVRVWHAVEGESKTKTAVFITHDVEEAVYLGDRVLIFSKGPARLAGDIRINLSGPRLGRSKRDPAFMKYVDEVLSYLYGSGVIKQLPRGRVDPNQQLLDSV